MIVVDPSLRHVPARRRSAPRRLALGAAAALTVIGLGACRSEPGTRRVAVDIIESVPGLTTSERECMLDRLDEYTDDDLSSIADGNEDVDWGADEPQISEELQRFGDDLAECRAAAPGTEPAGSTGSEPPTSEPD